MFPSPSRGLAADRMLLVAFALWTLVPAIVLLGGHGVFNGGLGVDVPDLMQYMGFIRESGQHGLIASPFNSLPDRHLFLDPAFAISGLVWRAGASIQLALLLWVPITAIALAAGFLAYARRMVGPDRLAIAVVLALAFFYVNPAMALSDWLHWGSLLRFGTKVMGLEMFAGDYASGGGSALGVALMPVYLLAIERILVPARRRPGRGERWYAGWASAAGLLATWIHPWQGVTLLVILAVLVIWGRFDRMYLKLAVPFAFTASPLLYFVALSHTHSSWMVVSRPNNYSHFGWWLLVSLLPVILAIPGYRGHRLDVQERIVRIWPLAAFAIYLAMNSTWFYHDFDGLTLPLAILALRGWRRLRLPSPMAAALIAAVTIPGLVWYVQQLVAAKPGAFFQPGEAQALRFLEKSPTAGPVLAPVFPLGQAVPAFTGRLTYAGHYYWTPDYFQRLAVTNALFDARLSRLAALRLVRDSQAAFLLSDCQRGRRDLTSLLGTAVVGTWRFGCARIYEVRDPGARAG